MFDMFTMRSEKAIADRMVLTAVIMLALASGGVRGSNGVGFVLMGEGIKLIRFPPLEITVMNSPCLKHQRNSLSFAAQRQPRRRAPNREREGPAARRRISGLH